MERGDRGHGGHRRFHVSGYINGFHVFSADPDDLAYILHLAAVALLIDQLDLVLTGHSIRVVMAHVHPFATTKNDNVRFSRFPIVDSQFLQQRIYFELDHLFIRKVKNGINLNLFSILVDHHFDPLLIFLSCLLCLLGCFLLRKGKNRARQKQSQ